MIAADGEDRPVAPNDMACPFKGVQFGSFDIHFDKGGAFLSEGIIKTDARNHGFRSTGNAASTDTIPGKVDGPVVSTDRGFMQHGSNAYIADKSLQAGYHREVSLKGNNLAKAIIGVGDEGLDRVSGIGPTIDKTLVSR
ncbi:MAG TPA: hypothetical protein VK828_18650 [Terriglobales bacterium]|nr:hypothetical protein [Terriglobales bacterium]